MEKRAAVDHTIYPLLTERWSPRAFNGEALSRDEISSLLEAARWAPSSYNDQPWAFIAASRDDKERFQKIFDCLVDFNRSWAHSAGALMVVLARKKLRTGAANRHARYDAGQAAAHLTFQAASMGLYVHQMGGFSSEQVAATFGAPMEYEPMAVIAVGRLGQTDDLPLSLQDDERAPRQRRPQKEFVFGDRWGEPY